MAEATSASSDLRAFGETSRRCDSRAGDGGGSLPSGVLAASASVPALSRTSTERSTTHLGRRLMMASSEASLPRASPGSAVASAPALSPLSCARRLRQELAAASSPAFRSTKRASAKAPAGDEKALQVGGSLLRSKFSLCKDEDAEAAIGARLREKGDAANPLMMRADSLHNDFPAASLLECGRDKDRLARQHQAARLDFSRRLAEARDSGDPLPSEMSYSDRQELVMQRKLDGEIDTMLQKIQRARSSSYREASAKPGGAIALSKSLVLANYCVR
eukprot:TRINITY_DN12752_c0_g3_i1.p1 TRINITY_DN12752_c0_g3~~TRINITY_DN12752_c0_g3_i1.p1  ORF type:complete len:276 (+),score=59.62 TRINITY_DN12752_c0_g3_i1:121-948(+)